MTQKKLKNTSYTAPKLDVTSFRTEQGYAASGTESINGGFSIGINTGKLQ